MKQSNPQIDFKEDSDSKQKNYHKMIEMYYNSNLSLQASMFKRCIPDLDCNYENRFIRKNEKLWIEANLTKLVQKASDKIQKLCISKNQYIKSSIDAYHNCFQTLPLSIKSKIISSKQYSKELRNRKKCNTFPFRNQSFSVQNVNSEPSCATLNARKTLTSKRIFRVRQFKNNVQEILNDARYTEKLQKVKLQSTFAQFFFQKNVNPEQNKTISFDRNNLDKIKAMTNIRWNFSLSQKSQKIHKVSFPRQSQNIGKSLGFELKRQNYYKPKSKCQGRNTKIFLNF